MTTLIPRPLTERHAKLFSHRIRRADLDDLHTSGQYPYAALLDAIEAGEAYGIWDGIDIIGAGGWTRDGNVWSLWTDLSVSQSKALIKNAVPWARIIAIRARRPLGNFFLRGNTVTDGWLRLTRCVEILDDRPLTWQGRTYIPFYLKPLEELPLV